MIGTVKEIITDDPVPKTWQFLRMFLDQDAAEDAIRSAHVLERGGRFQSNVKKQARQIGYCIRQAEEYFDAASRVGLATRPNLLYYGATTLTRALVLLRQDGKFSIDALRQSQRHRHHGLDLVEEFTVVPQGGLYADPVSFFGALACRCHLQNAAPWGHFGLCYDSLVPAALCVLVHKSDKAWPGIPRTWLSVRQASTSVDVMPLDELAQRDRIRLLDLLKGIPDLYADLLGMGEQPNLCPGDCEVRVVYEFEEGDDGVRRPVGLGEEHTYTVECREASQRELLLAMYQSRDPSLRPTLSLGSSVRWVWRKTYLVAEGQKEFWQPDMVEDLRGGKYFLTKPQDHVPEPAAHLAILFCLGMLSRYYPDVWMKAIGERATIAEFVESLLNVIQRKLPNLILDQLTWIRHVIHS